MGGGGRETSGLVFEREGDSEFLSARFGDFEELSTAVAAWDFDFVQLDAGPSPAALTQVSAPGLLIQRFRFGRNYLQRGSSPPDRRTFGLVEQEARDTRMFGEDLTKSDLAVFRTDGEFDSVSQPGFGCITISVNEERIAEASAAIELPHGNATESGLLRVDPTVLARLRRRATQLLDQLEADPDQLGRSEISEELSFQLPIDLASAIQSAHGPSPRAASRVRDLALRRAVSIIEDRVDEPITVGGLCKEVGVGWTTLTQAFQEHFGVTPKAYLRTIRLNGTRRGLLAAAPEDPIADVANRWGFWHMGQFAADYRRLFGELPSETRTRQ